MVGAVYRPPGFNNIFNFFNQFEEVISKHLMDCENLICMGDFNINLMNMDNIHTQQFMSLLESYNLHQCINDSTRHGSYKSTLLDLILCSNNDVIKKSEVVDNLDISDHSLIRCMLHVTTVKPQPKLYTYRDFSSFVYDQFYAELCNMPFENIFYIDSIDEKLEYFNYLITSLFDIYAPTRTVKITKRKAPWMTDNVKLLCKLRDKALIKYKRTQNIEDWNNYKQMRNFVNTSIKKEKKAYLEFATNRNNCRNSWDILKELDIYSKNKTQIPENLRDVKGIQDYFCSITQENSVPNEGLVNSYLNNIKDQNITKFQFKCVTEEEIYNQILSIKSKATGHDNININMLLYCCPLIIPFVTHLINFCIENSVFPNSWKIAHIIPVPKINHAVTFKDLRPISILPTLSKIIERILDSQIREHIKTFNLLTKVQSGFRPNHSCTTAVLHVTDDIISAIDKNDVTVLILLDYSKAFDRLNYNLFLAILNFYGFQSSAINLIKNYLTDRKQLVKINDMLSEMKNISCGVPQGSILGPLFFTIYTSELTTCIKHCTCHLYADDTQLYLAFNADNVDEAITNISRDLRALQKFSEDHCLIINPDKCKAMVFGRKLSRLKCEQHIKLEINNVPLEIVDSTKNLGIIMDNELRFTKHVSSCIKKAFYNLKLLYNHRAIISRCLKKQLCDSLVLSHFNYGDIIYGPCLTAYDSQRIQLVQNSCVRFIFGIRKFQSGISKHIYNLGWLSMEGRRLLHCLVLYNKIISSKCPSYLFDKISFRRDIHHVNVRYKNLLTIPSHKTAVFQRSFKYNICKLYNRVPSDTKTFSSYKFKKSIEHLLLQNNSKIS